MTVDLLALANGVILVVAIVGGLGVLWSTLVHPTLRRTIRSEVYGERFDALGLEEEARA